MMKIKDIELANISRFRGELMGTAMLFIILFHVGLPRHDLFFGLRRMGNVGVDIFLFLSGVGLWYSWSKLRGWSESPMNTVGRPASVPAVAPMTLKQALKTFYWRRLLRIYPAWLIMAGAFYVPDFLTRRWYSTSLIDLIGDLTINWDFWLHNELTFWYIPATMMLYLFAPPYMELIRRHPIYRWLPVVMIMWCILVQWVTPIHHAVGHLEIFWSRVPIFFIGINMGESVKRKHTVDGAGIWMIILMFVMTLASSIFLEQVRHGQFPLFIERMLYIPLTVTSILLLNRIFRRLPAWLNRCFAMVGALSLEAYLIHYQFILIHLERLGWTYWPTFLMCVAITLPAAWLLHQLVIWIERRLTAR